jgi:Destabilase
MGEMLPPEFYRAINFVEASGRVGMVVGERGEIGPMQISRQYWRDSGVQGAWHQCTNYAYSCKVMDAYFRRFAPDHLQRQDYEKLARIHNGGPMGHRRPSTKAYWLRVRKFL